MPENTLIVWLPPTLAAAGAGLSVWIARQERRRPGAARLRGRLGLRCRHAEPLVEMAGGAGGVAGGSALSAGPWRGSRVDGGAGSALAHAAREVLLGAAPLLAAAAVWFIGIQLLLIRRLCLYCVAVHGIGTATAAAIALGHAGLPRGEFLGAIRLAAAGFAALVLGQVVVAPRTYTVVHEAARREEGTGGELRGADRLEEDGGESRPSPYPSPGVPGEGTRRAPAAFGDRGELSAQPGTPSLTLPRSTGGGNKTLDAESPAPRVGGIPGPLRYARALALRAP